MIGHAFRHARRLAAGVTGVALASLWPATASAQPLGAFRWQTQPYCNVLTLTVTRSGSVYALDGFDDQCGAENVAPLTGTAALNPDGTVELAMHIVSPPAAAAVHLTARLHAGSLSGTWQDSVGASGSFASTPATGSGGSARPFASSVLVSATIVDPAQVQLRVTGTCPPGQSIQRINGDGSVGCAPASANAGDITAVTTAAGSGLQGGADTGVANVRLATKASGAFDLTNPSGLVARGALSVGTAPAAGQGARTMWYPGKAAFRAGYAEGTEWDDANVGPFSVAMGRNAQATGYASVALGQNAFATAEHAVAIGSFAEATARHSLAIGRVVWARPSDTGAIVIGDGAPLSGLQSSVPNQFSARAAGGYRFFSSAQALSGVTLAADASAWAPISDGNAKDNFRDLDGEELLTKLARMPIREWNYKTQDAAIRHAGPTAQDFHAAFGLGEDPLRISTIDADGIALRAIQALEARVRAHRERLQRIEEALAGQR